MRHYNKEKTFAIITSDILAPKEQNQESNNNQTLLALRKATEWEKGGLDYPPSSLYFHACMWPKFVLPEYAICRIATIIAFNSKNSKMP